MRFYLRYGPQYCAGTRAEDIGITTPYRRQLDKIADALIASIDSDTGPADVATLSPYLTRHKRNQSRPAGHTALPRMGSGLAQAGQAPTCARGPARPAVHDDRTGVDPIAGVHVLPSTGQRLRVPPVRRAR